MSRKKTKHSTSDHNLDKCRVIFKILPLSYSEQIIYVHDVADTSTSISPQLYYKLQHYRAKSECSKLPPNFAPTFFRLFYVKLNKTWKYLDDECRKKYHNNDLLNFCTIYEIQNADNATKYDLTTNSTKSMQHTTSSALRCYV